MPTTLDTRKPVDDLSLEDLDCFPIWEFAMDEAHRADRDETWVRPVPGERVRKSGYSKIVATQFQSPLGRILQGFMVVATAGTNIEIRPGAIISGRYSVLPMVSREIAEREGCTWSVEDRDRLVDALNAGEVEVFPLKYRLKAVISGETLPRTGVVE